MTEPSDLLAASDRIVLAVAGPSGPLLAPMATWWDGAHLWMTTPADSAKVRVMRTRGRAVAWVPPTAAGEGTSADAAGGTGEGVVVRGSVKLYGLGDPVRLALHGPALSGAVAALASRNVDRILGYAQDATRVPARFLPRNRLIVRLAVEELRTVERPAVGPGIAPPLPAEVPPAVRRILGGRRRVTLAVGEEDLRILPAVLGAGYAIDAGEPLPVGVPAAAAVDAEPGRRPTAVTGLVLRGDLEAGGRLAVRRATWWQGFEIGTVDVAPARRPTIELPD